MKVNSIVMAAFVLLLAPLASADFDAKNPGQTPDLILVDIDDVATSVNSIREFTVDANETARLQLDEAVATGWILNATYSPDGGTTPEDITWATATGAASSPFNVTLDDAGLLDFAIELPTARTAFHTTEFGVSVNLVTSGGRLDHDILVRFYNGTLDADHDGLKDTWELQYFGGYQYGGLADPDGDGYNNFEEHDADSNPNDETSVPRTTVVSIGGADIDDRESGQIIAGIVLTAIVMAAVAFLVGDKAERKALAITAAVSVVFIASLVLFAAFDWWGVLGTDWAWWQHLQSTAAEWTVTGLGIAAILFLGAYFAAMVPQSHEKAVVLTMTVGVLVWILGAVAVFVFADVNLPW